MNSEAKNMWSKFIAQLNLEKPIGGDGHKNFLGSIEKYKEVFLRANKEEKINNDPYTNELYLPPFFNACFETHSNFFGQTKEVPMPALIAQQLHAVSRESYELGFKNACILKEGKENDQS